MSRSPAQRQGAWAEQRVLRLLRLRGWQLLERNWRCRWGELDLVVQKPGRLLLVEVKGRRPGNRDGWGTAALRRPKRRRLARAWSCWLADHPRWERTPVEQVAALVPLPPSTAPVRWIRLGD
ncbi:YraN family protein [Synechococcus sp. CCY 9618]|uniref:YraN family protein n=1 Tax=Synechococcus sp. CCY 9618 TaxID=2815602 RepID=UPI001C2171DC|nr:YraN family protein [Synechococcus sp. CCY 9618]